MKSANIYLDKYTSLKMLGRGTFGEVILVEDQHRNKLALKLINRQKIQGKNQQLLSYLQDQIKCMSDLKGKHVVRLIQCQQDDKNYYLFMEYCDGGDLLCYQYQLPNRVFQFDEATLFLSQVILGLEEMHQKGYLHRDIKSQNILVKNQNGGKVIKIADFGYSKKAKKITGTILGTQNYISPQIYKCGSSFGDEDQSYGFQIDVWAFGVLFYYMLNFSYPFDLKFIANYDLKYSELMRQAKKFSYKKSVSNSAKKIIQYCTEEMQDFFQRIFEPQSKKRITFKQIKKHPIFSKYFKIQSLIDLQDEPEKRILMLQFQKINFLKEIVDEMQPYSQKLGGYKFYMFAYNLTRYRIILLRKFIKNMASQTYKQKYPQFQWQDYAQSASFHHQKQYYLTNLQAANEQFQIISHKCKQSERQIDMISSSFSQTFKLTVHQSIKQLQGSNLSCYRESTQIMYLLVKTFLKTNKILKFYMFFCLVSIAHVFKDLVQYPDLVQNIFIQFINKQKVDSQSFSFKSLMIFLRNSNKETVVGIVKDIIQGLSQN